MEKLRRERNSYEDQKGALCASLLLHALLLLVLRSNANFIPSLGAQTRIDFLWLASTPQATPQTASPAPVAPAPHPACQASRRASPPPARTAAAAPPRATERKAMAKDTPSPPPPASEGVKGPEETMRVPAALLHQSPATVPSTIRLSAPARQEDAVTGAVPNRETAAAMPTRPTEPAPVLLKSPPPADATADAPADATANATANAPANAPASAAVITHAISPATTDTLAATSAPTASPARTGRRIGAAQPTPPPQRATETGAGLAAEQLPPTRQKQKARPPTDPADSHRGTAIASLKGDLKMTIAGDHLKVTVLFRAYPRSRRKEDPTRAEAGRARSVTPVCADATDRSREAVVEKAGEGVYLFVVEPERGSRAQATFTLKIYEAGAGERVVRLGGRAISGRTVLARVLMPEGILWDDPGAFTGSIEDAESTTKFNARTGLTWKEYDE